MFNALRRSGDLALAAVIVVTSGAVSGASTVQRARLGMPSGARLEATVTANTSAPGPSTKPIQAVTPCSQLMAVDFTKVQDAPTRVMSATVTTINGASYCEVRGYVSPQVLFDLRLPTSTWTGRYVQEGCGGYCGILQPGPPAVSTNCPAVTGNQLALGVDDEGHVGSSAFDGLWAANAPELRVSFGFTSEHALAQAAKAIIAAYYGQRPRYSYFDGCSDGGREALIEAQRYPDDFNGILAGAPANIWADLNGEFQEWNILANTDAHGHPILTAEVLPALHAAVVAACGNAQGLIPDPRSCGFDPASIQCHPGQASNSCLTPAQVAAARRIYRGPTLADGRSLSPGGEPYGSELAWQGWLIDPASDTAWPADTAAYQIAINYLKYQAYRANPPSTFTLADFHFDRADYERLQQLAGLYDAIDPDLAPFARLGGRIILYHGWADQAIPPFGTVGYYAAVVSRAGGFAASQAFSRLYMIPDQYHCLGGGSPQVTADLLTPLMNWVEKGIAPGAITLPLTAPTPTLQSITVSPLNPLLPPAGGARGLNASYNWIGSFQREPTPSTFS